LASTADPRDLLGVLAKSVTAEISALSSWPCYSRPTGASSWYNRSRTLRRPVPFLILLDFLFRFMSSNEITSRTIGPLWFIILMPLSACAALVGVAAYNYYPTIALVAIGCPLIAVGAWWLLQSPYRCMCALVAMLPLEASAVLEIGFTLRLAYVMIVLLSVSTWRCADELGVPRSPALKPLAFFALVCVVSTAQLIIWPPPPTPSLQSTLEMRGSAMRVFVQLFLLAIHVMLFVNVLAVVRSKFRIRTAIQIFVVTALLVATYALYQPVAVTYNLPLKDITNAIATSGNRFGGVLYSGGLVSIRPRATFQEAGNLGQFLLAALAILFVYNPFVGGTRKVAHYAAISLLTWSLIATLARGSYVGWMAAMVAMVLAGAKRAISRQIAVSGLALAVFVVVVFPMIGLTNADDISFLATVVERFSGDPSSQERLKSGSVLFDVWTDHPILGVGFGAYGAYGASLTNASILLSANGVWWSVLAETGIIGFCVFCWFVATLLLGAFRGYHSCRDPELKAIIGGLGAAVVGVLTQYLFIGDRMTSFVWFLLALLAAATSTAKNRSKRAERTEK